MDENITMGASKLISLLEKVWWCCLGVAVTALETCTLLDVFTVLVWSSIEWSKREEMGWCVDMVDQNSTGTKQVLFVQRRYLPHGGGFFHLRQDIEA